MRYAFMVASLTLLLLAACGTTAAPTETPVPVPGTPVPISAPTGTPTSTPTETASPIETPGATVAPVLTSTSAATPKAPALLAPPEPSALLDALAKLPLSFKEKGVWLGDPGRALELAGASHPRNFQELAALDQGDLEQYN